MAMAPVIYGESDRPPRGDYGEARSDYTCDQHWERYSAQEHARYAQLFARQVAQSRGHACEEFIAALRHLGDADHIPRFDAISNALHRATGWQVVAVPGLIPEHAFFDLLATRRFPVTVWLRTADEFEYIVEPDVFHDLYGHVPLLFDPVFADFMQAFGRGGQKAQGLQALAYLARLYWYTVEFGLLSTSRGLRVYGAGILSSVGETQYALTSAEPRRLAFDLMDVLRTPYKIDQYQSCYFVVESFRQLFEATAPDFTPLYVKAAAEVAAEKETAAESLTHSGPTRTAGARPRKSYPPNRPAPM